MAFPICVYKPFLATFLFRTRLVGTVTLYFITGNENESDFGFDPIFLPEGYDKTFAELSKGEKNKISMRRMALNKLKDYLSEQ
jgi:XTP/dITP diphosphohydrolase